MKIIAKLPENYEYNLTNEFYKTYIMPQIHKIAKQIDDDIRSCIKEEINKYGSIVKRYGDWAKFIKKEMCIANYPIDPKYPYLQTLFYRGKHIRDYDIKTYIGNRLYGG